MENFITFLQYCINVLSPIVSLGVSIVAIWVTLYTVNKQNKASLFEKRLDVFCLLTFISDFATSIKGSFEATSTDGYVNVNVNLLTVWVNNRLVFSNKANDNERLKLVSDAMKGKPSQELINVMKPYLLHDLHLLRQGVYMFKGSIADAIEETANSYESFIGNLLTIPNGNGVHSGDKAKEYFDDFLKVSLKWREDSRIKKALDEDMHII